MDDDLGWRCALRERDFNTLCLSMLAVLFLSIPACTSGISGQEAIAEAQFREMIDVRVPKRVVFYTDKKTYQRQELIRYWVENRTGQTLWFVDQSLGLRAYQYDEGTQRWKTVDLGFTVGAPQRTAIQPSGPSIMPNYAIDTDRIKRSGKIRLVIMGVMDDGQEFAAYTDVEIVEP